ncbi:MAG: oligosaccharide flippase family protein [Lachnospiraceae bacterium]|nr:oligosaccharide flippase family protein [Lachnospiraceae bacterium]
MDKIKKIAKTLWKKGLIHILAGSFLSKLVTFFGSIFIVNVLTKREYGVLSYLENLYGYFFIFAGMGLSNSILRYVVLGESDHEKYSYYSYSYRKSFIWNLLLVIVAEVICYLYPHPSAYQNYRWLILVMVTMLPFQYAVDNVLCNERAMFANQRYAVLSLLFSLGIIISKVISGSMMGITGVVFSQVFVYLVLAIIYLYIEKKKYYSSCVYKKLPRDKKHELDVYAFQYMITNGLWAFFMLNDTFLLGKFCTPEIVAEYKVAYTIPGSVTLISSAVGIFVAPYFVKYQEDREWVKINYFKVFILNAALVGILCLFIAIFSPYIIGILYGDEYLEIVRIMRILLLAAFLNCGLRFTTANILAAMGQVKYNMYISLVGTVLQILLNLYSIPIYGLVGVAITSCLVYGMMAIVLFVIFKRKYYR